MAIHNSASEASTPNVSNQGLGNEAQVFETNLGKASSGQKGGRALTFGGSGLSLMSAGQGSEYTNNIANVLADIYKNSQRSLKPAIHILDKEVLNLAYSTIVVSLQNKDDISYFIILLEATGRKPLTASEIMSEYTALTKAPNQNRFAIYTADAAIDDVLHNHIHTVLRSHYKADKFVSVDGIVLHTNHSEFDKIAHMIATIAYNACLAETVIDGENVKDLDLELSAREVASSGERLKYESFMGKSTHATPNELDAPVRSDWRVDLVSVNTSNTVRSLNLQNNRNQITRVAGFVDALPEETTINDNGVAKQVLRFRPHIVVTSNSSTCPTLGFALLGLLSSTVMTKQNMWLGALRPTTKQNVGALNVITKVDKGVGEKIDLSNKKYSMDEVWSVIAQMYSLDPVVSMDVEAFGPQTYYLSAFSAAANPINTGEKQAAGRLIVSAASQLTGGRFPSNFNPDLVFAHEGVIIPTGTYTDKHGERDIREIDLALLANMTDDPAILNTWALSNLPASKSGLDPFITKVDIINRLIPSAEITGKAIRVTFSALFINELINTAIACNFNADIDPEVKRNADHNLSIMASMYQGAGINSNAGFAREFVAAGPNYHSLYSSAFYNR